jgi:hypothetical protein
MRLLLIIALFLSTLLVLWCAAGYFAAPSQQIETRAELSRSPALQQPLTDADIAVHVSRVGRQGRNWGIAAALAGLSSLAVAGCLILASRRKTA